ncbi:MAG TPA: sulfotransferase [Steroidobacteraceae bacterium]|nr:sulfotransferase [Steroidobacteraceae bacterium]
MAQWPNFFVAGAPRCGTSTLHAWLPAIPGVFMSRIKEPNYFSRSVIGESHPMVKPIRDRRAYLQLFTAAGDAKAVGEATPFYLQDPEAPARIKKQSPDARVLVSLRDPVERLYSHYLMMRNNLPSMGSFMEEIERGLALGGRRNLAFLDPSAGRYSAQIARFRREFGRANFRVLILEEWSRDPAGTLREISEFLGLAPFSGEVPGPPQRRFAEARGPFVRFLFGNRKLSRAAEALLPYGLRKAVRNAVLVRKVPRPEMDPAARRFLVDYYREDVARTEWLLGRRLPWANFRDFAGSDDGAQAADRDASINFAASG